MVNKEKIKSSILETCSESEYGSWEFWSDGQNKSEAEAGLIAEAIIELVKEKSIFPTEYRFVKNQSYKEVGLDQNRLRKEVKISMNTKNVDPDIFYWFLAKEKKEENIIFHTKKIIDKYDPVNLSPGEVSPDDEYLSEAKIIAEKYRDISDLKNFLEHIKKLFIDRFSESVLDFEKLNQMSIELFSLMKLERINE